MIRPALWRCEHIADHIHESLARKAPTEYIFYSSMFREHKVNSKAMPLMVVELQCCPYLLDSSHMQSAMWKSHSILIAIQTGLANRESIAPSCSRLPYLNGETILNSPFRIIFPASVPGPFRCDNICVKKKKKNKTYSTVPIQKGLTWKLKNMLCR